MARLALGLLVLGCAAAVASAVYRWVARGEIDAALVIGGVLVFSLAVLLYTHFSLTHKAASNSYRLHDALLDIADLLRRQGEYMRMISENSSLSDWAKRVVYREKDYEYLHDTIQGALARQDWMAVERLIQELDEQFGLHEEAVRLGEELAQARKSTAEERVAAALRRFEQLCQAQKWEQAQRESQRLQGLFPGEPRLAGLAREAELRRQQYKRDLLKRYDDAVRTQNVDEAHRLLFELDHYLAPNEAGALKESARGVFKAKLQQMGVQFSLAVTDKHFRRAIAVGERLIREFPNSRYAQEINGMMPALRQRAVQETDGREP